MQIITGKTQTEHVNSEDDRALHAGTFGTGSYVLNVGTKLKATIESSNTIRLDCGELVHQGTHARVPYGTYDVATIDNGTTGYLRRDLIVARYERAGGFESMNIVTIKGQPAVSSPVAPDYEQGNILEGAEVSDMLLYEVLLNGVNIESVTPLFTILDKTLSDMQKDTYSTNEIDTKASQLQDGINKAQSSADGAQSAANAAQSSANAAQAAANGAQNSADSAMVMAKKGLVLISATSREISLNAGNSGTAAITNFSGSVAVPGGTEYVVAILKSISAGACFESVRTVVSGATCTLSGSASNEKASSGSIAFELLCFGRAENI